MVTQWADYASLIMSMVIINLLAWLSLQSWHVEC